MKDGLHLFQALALTNSDDGDDAGGADDRRCSSRGLPENSRLSGRRIGALGLRSDPATVTEKAGTHTHQLPQLLELGSPAAND